MKISSLMVTVALSVVAWMPSASAQDPNAPPGDAQSMQQPVDQTQLAEEEQGRPWVETGPDGQPIQPESGSETAAPEEAAPALTTPLRKGLSIQGSLGLSDCFDTYCGDPNIAATTHEGTSMGIGGELSGWFRPIEYVSFGLNLHYNIVAVDDQPDFDNSFHYITVDAGVRVHPLATGPVDVFLGPTFGYAWFSTAGEGPFNVRGFDVDGELSRSVSGWVFGLEAGGEYYITPQMSVGALFRFFYPFWSEHCAEFDSDFVDIDEDCDEVEDVEDLDEGDLPWMLYGGATFTYHLQLGG